MNSFQALRPDIEVNGHTILSVVAGLRFLGDIPLQILAHHGLDQVDPEDWYPQQAWLDAFSEIARKIGDQGLYLIGRTIPDQADFPENIRSIEDALASIDIAYHMNHRDRQGLLWDAEKRTMREGIGHYRFELVDPGKGVVLCDNPYPCPFDQGIVQAMGNRFRPEGTMFVHLEHGAHLPCRRRGDDRCEYIVTW